MNNRISLVLSLLVLSSASYTSMADSMVNFSIGFEKTSGDYGSDTTTEITTVPLNFQYMNDAWQVKLSVPFISISGDGSIIPGGTGGGSGLGGGSNTTTTSVVQTQSGLGDIVSSLSYAFIPENDSFMFSELTAEIKWGTASVEKNLGTGENDYSVSFYNMYEKYDLKPFLSLGYLLMGDTDVTDYNDVLIASAGIMHQFNEKTLLTVVYDYQQETIDGADDSQTVSIYLNKKLAEQWTANVYVLSGLSNAVADSGFGFSLMRNF